MSATTLRDKIENARFRRMMAEVENRSVAILFWDVVLCELQDQLQTVAA